MNAASDARQATGEGFSEFAVRFGDGLVGSLCLPDLPGTPASGCGVILLNAGLVHHAGPFRINALLSRRLAQAGFPTLRFDKPGVGDSDNATSTDPVRRRLNLEAAFEAIKSRTSIDRFVVGGICSGADEAFRLAESDPRPAGLLLIDGFAFRTPGFWLRHVLPRLMDWRRLREGLRRSGKEKPSLVDFREFPGRKEARRRMRALAQANVKCLFVFTGGAYPYFNHRQQLRQALGAAAMVNSTLEHWPDSDHTFYLQEHRERLIGAIESWMRNEFANDTRGMTSA